MKRRIVIAAAAVFVLFGSVLAGALAAAGGAGTVSPGVTVRDIYLGGLDAEAAEEVLASAGPRWTQVPLRLRADGREMEMAPSALGVQVDVRATVNAALDVGGSDSAVRGLWERLAARVRGRTVPVSLRVDEARWVSGTDEVVLNFERLVKNGRLLFDGGRPKAVAAETGVIVDREALRARLLQAVLEGRAAVDVPVELVAPAVSTEEAQAALEVVRRALAEPVVLGYQGREFSIGPDELSAIVDMNPAGIGSGLPLTFDTDQARDVLGARLASLENPPLDAVIVPATDGKGFTVVPSAEGTLVEWPALLDAMVRVAAGDGRRYVPVPTTPAHPRLTTEDAKQLGSRREIASFTTFFSPSSGARVHNIQQVAAILDGRVIRPGESFSFNTAVGPRTQAAGFDEAPVIRDGVLTPGVGGGICQVSTTLFNAVFFAGLPVVERKPHSFYIDHYPMGRDATVSYGSVDFKFRNDSETVLLLSVTAADNSVTVSLAAPTWDRTVEYDTSEFYDLVEPPSSAENPRRFRDPALSKGAVSDVEMGVAGRTVDVRRVVKGAGGTVLFEDDFRSIYGPKDFVVRVGS
ncbi:MAG: VanW family protein [Thermoleophilia bacterium]